MLLSVFGLCVVFWSQSFEFLWVYGSFWFWERIMFCLCSVLVTALGLLVHFCDSVSYLSLCLNVNKFLFYFDMSFDFPCYSWFVPAVFPTCCLLSSLPCVYIAWVSSCPLLCPPLIVCLLGCFPLGCVLPFSVVCPWLLPFAFLTPALPLFLYFWKTATLKLFLSHVLSPEAISHIEAAHPLHVPGLYVGFPGLPWNHWHFI